MFNTLAGLITFTATVVAGIAGFITTRNFVRRRLRFVDAVRSPMAPMVAGVAGFLIAWPVVAILPLVSIGTAIIFGVACGAGTASGVKAIVRGEGPFFPR